MAHPQLLSLEPDNVVNAALIDQAVISGTRIGVVSDYYEQIMQTFGVYNSATSSYEAPVTHRSLILTKPVDTTTGWYQKRWVNEQANMLIIDRSVNKMALTLGAYVKLDAVGASQDVFEVGDQVCTEDGELFEVKAFRARHDGRDFSHYEYDLTYLPLANLHNLSYSAPTAEDARYRQKVYLETHLSRTKVPHYHLCYANPDYPIVPLFQQKGHRFIFLLHEPESQPLLSSTHSSYGYDEKINVEVATTDTETASGTVLQHQAETELRRILETYPSGSSRTFDAQTAKPQLLGSTTLYSLKVSMRYKRGVT